MTKSITDLARDAGFDAEQWRAMTYETGPYDITEPTIEFEKFATLHRAAILEELTREMPEPIGAVYTINGVISHCMMTKALHDTNLYTELQMRKYAAGLVAKAVAEKQIQVDAGNRCIEILEAELAKKDAKIALAKYNEDTWYGRFMEAAQSAHDFQREKSVLTAERDAARAENLGYAKALLDLEAEVKQLTADARRYRWLRQYDIDSYLACGKLEQLDAAIDKAMK